MTPRHVLFLWIWSFADPSQATGSEEERLPVFRWVRDEIGLRIRAWLSEEGLP